MLVLSGGAARPRRIDGVRLMVDARCRCEFTRRLVELQRLRRRGGCTVRRGCYSRRGRTLVG